LAVSLGVATRVSFPGLQTNPAAWLRHASLFVLPSRFEGFPNALLEAMQCGLPAVAFNCPSGPSEIIRDGVDGFLVPPEDVSALTNAMVRLVRDKGLRDQVARRALEVVDRFPPEKIYSMWLNLCDKLAIKSSRA
jgi:glycosyltransferase involved in cell wall biosynthesis